MTSPDRINRKNDTSMNDEFEEESNPKYFVSKKNSMERKELFKNQNEN